MPTRFKSVLALRNFRYLVGTTTIDALGARISHMLLIALIALAHPGKVLAYSEGSLIVGLPPIIFAPFIGVLVDRWNRRQTLLVTHLAQTAFLLLAPLLFFLTGSLAPAWIVLFLFFTADIFKNSSAPALLPAVIGVRGSGIGDRSRNREPGIPESRIPSPESRILAANSLWFAFARAATVVGMIGGGYLVSLTGWKWSFSINGVTHLAAGLLVLGIPAATGRSQPPGGALWEGSDHHDELSHALATSSRRFFVELQEVILLVGHNRFVAFVMFTIVASLGITGIAYTLLSYVIQQVMKLGTSGVGIYSGIMAVGMLGGSLLIGVIGDRISRTRVIVLGLAVIGGLFVAGPWLINRWYVGIVALVAGVAFSWIGIAQTAILQTRVSPDVQGRIFATREFFGNVTFLLTTFIMGAVSLVAGYRLLLVLSGAALLVFCGVGWLIVRGLEEDATADN